MAESILCIKKPKRCLTAYNLFFHDERQKLLENHPEGAEEEGKPKLGFGPLARTVSAKWKKITDEEKAKFVALAKKDRERYDEEMREWRAMQAKLEQLLQDSPASGAIAALQSSARNKKDAPKEKNRKAPPKAPPKTPPQMSTTTPVPEDPAFEPDTTVQPGLEPTRDDFLRTNYDAKAARHNDSALARRVSHDGMGRSNSHNMRLYQHQGNAFSDQHPRHAHNQSFAVPANVPVNDYAIGNPANSLQRQALLNQMGRQQTFSSQMTHAGGAQMDSQLNDFQKYMLAEESSRGTVGQSFSAPRQVSMNEFNQLTINSMNVIQRQMLADVSSRGSFDQSFSTPNEAFVATAGMNADQPFGSLTSPQNVCPSPQKRPGSIGGFPQAGSNFQGRILKDAAAPYARMARSFGSNGQQDY